MSTNYSSMSSSPLTHDTPHWISSKILCCVSQRQWIVFGKGRIDIKECCKSQTSTLGGVYVVPRELEKRTKRVAQRVQILSIEAAILDLVLVIAKNRNFQSCSLLTIDYLLLFDVVPAEGWLPTCHIKAPSPCPSSPQLLSAGRRCLVAPTTRLCGHQATTSHRLSISWSKPLQ